MEEAGASAAEKGGAAPSQTDSRFLRSNASSPSLEEDACARENCTLWVSASARTYDCLARKALAASPLKGGAAIGGRPSLHFGGQKQQRQRAPSFDVAFPSHALCLHSAASKSFHSELESPAIQQQRRRLPPARLLAETLAGVETSEEEGSSGTASAELRPSFLRQDGTLNLRHKCFREHYLHLLLNDRFHAFLELKWAQLVAVIFVAVCAAAAVLAGEKTERLEPAAFCLAKRLSRGVSLRRALICRASLPRHWRRLPRLSGEVQFVAGFLFLRR